MFSLATPAKLRNTRAYKVRHFQTVLDSYLVFGLWHPNYTALSTKASSRKYYAFRPLTPIPDDASNSTIPMANEALLSSNKNKALTSLKNFTSVSSKNHSTQCDKGSYHLFPLDNASRLEVVINLDNFIVRYP
jgi:hypothetical protein